MTTVQQLEEKRDRHHEVEIEVNYRRIRVPEQVTGAQIKEAAHLNATFDLFEIRGEDEVPVANDVAITVHHGEKFVATPGLEPA